jgi:hypothetical protein
MKEIYDSMYIGASTAPCYEPCFGAGWPYIRNEHTRRSVDIVGAR